MTKQQLAAWFEPNAGWALEGQVPQTAAVTNLLKAIQKVLLKTAVELPGVPAKGASAQPFSVATLEGSLFALYNNPVSDYRLAVPTNVRRFCGRLLRPSCGQNIERVIVAPAFVAQPA